MMKIRYIIVCLLFVMFVPKVYAFTYEMDMSVNNTSVKVGTNTEIKVSLKDIQGTDNGIVVCSLNITSSENVIMKDVKTLNSWSLTVGDIYLLDTGNPAVKDSEMFIIPVKINGEGFVEISNIVCANEEEEVEIGNKKINFSIKKEDPSTGSSGNGSNKDNNATEDNDKLDDNKLSSNCNISSVELSEGSIEFDPNITEYEIKIGDFNKLEIMVTLESPSASYILDENIVGDKKSVVITVNAEDGSSKTYTIYVEEENSSVANTEDKKENNYTIIFIVIICILVLINIYRIVRNKKK